MPVEQRLRIDPDRLSWPAARSTAKRRRHENRSWKFQAPQNRRCGGVKVRIAVVEGKHYRALGQWLAACQGIHHLAQRRNPRIGLKPLHLLGKQARRDMERTVSFGNRMIRQNDREPRGIHGFSVRIAVGGWPAGW